MSEEAGRVPIGALALSCAAIVAWTTWPWSQFAGHGHWASVVWLPLADPELKPLEMALNVALFAPLGWSLRSGGLRLVLVATFGAILSLSAEIFQVYCHGRFPTVTDVCLNTLGGLIGGLLIGRALPAPRVGHD
jgi:hypothetical protein